MINGEAYIKKDVSIHDNNGFTPPETYYYKEGEENYTYKEVEGQWYDASGSLIDSPLN